MANLYDWQTPDYVLAGKPWGDKKDGNVTISSCLNTYSAGTAAINQKNGNCASANLANGDLFVAIQMQGAGAGNWQFNMVVSGGGTTSITCKKDFKYDFVSGAQFIKVLRHNVASVSAHNVPTWNGTIYGVEFILAGVSITPTGTMNGGGIGFQGHVNGGGQNLPDNIGYNGYGSGGSVSRTLSVNGNGGGGAPRRYGGGTSHGGGGGGGGHASTGDGGSQAMWDGTFQGAYGTGGSAVGSADLTSLFMGGAGGKGSDAYYEGCASGSGGAITVLISKFVDTSSYGVSNVGGAGSGALDESPGGGGAGGSILVICDTATLGTNKLVATGGAGGYSSRDPRWGGAGSTGRIAVHHKGTVTGSTNPAFTSVEDLKLVEIAGASMIQPH